LAHRFITKQPNDLASLFGEGVNVNEQSHRWIINNEVFEKPEAYAGVIAAPGVAGA